MQCESFNVFYLIQGNPHWYNRGRGGGDGEKEGEVERETGNLYDVKLKPQNIIVPRKQGSTNG